MACWHTCATRGIVVWDFPQRLPNHQIYESTEEQTLGAITLHLSARDSGHQIAFAFGGLIKISDLEAIKSVESLINHQQQLAKGKINDGIIFQQNGFGEIYKLET